MDYLVWVGPRDTDWIYDSSFLDAICYYSQNNKMPERNAHIYGEIFNSFVEDQMKKKIEEHPNAKFLFYNQKIVYSLHKSLRKYVICVNEKRLLEILTNKIYMRYWAGNYVPVLPSLLIDSKSLSFDLLHQKLDKSNEFIVQQSNNSGGFGTFYMSDKNHMLSTLKEDYNELFIVSSYVAKNIPINVNAIIFQDNIMIFPPSLQIVSLHENRLLYQGADFFTTQNLSKEIINNIYTYAEILLKRIQSWGYRGILGIDFIIADNCIYFQEVNPRYQASSFLINAALRECGLSSLSTMNIAAFSSNTFCFEKETQIKVNYSFYKEIYTHGNRHLYYLWKAASKNIFIKDIFSDGWNPEIQMENDSYCFTLVFSTNITSLNLDGSYNLYSNISGEERFIQEHSKTDIGLKISLLNQGCVITDKAKQYLQTNGMIKKAVFSSIDFYLKNGTSINVPVDLKFTDFSPYTIDVDSCNKICLYYYDNLISEISIEMQPKWGEQLTKNGVPYKKIAYLSADRLRIKHEMECVFKTQNRGCYFCSIPKSREKQLVFAEDYEEVIHQLFKDRHFRHILIGGASAPEKEEFQQVIAITKLIRNEDANIPIYLMCIPPINKDILKRYKDAGINEVAFNIEIWDRQLALQIMPGKGHISLEKYIEALKESTKLWGTSGNVRTALIVGLNKTDSLFQAIETLCQYGIQPMLSIFRPMESTKLYSIVPPSNAELLNIYNCSQEICKRYNLQLGPSCDACKNNMLA